jgi:asparagine synthase (glutamine-hydrolysing)
VCEALGLPLAEGWRDLSRIDIGRSDSAHLPRPNVRMFFQESRRLAQEAATATGASAIFNGGGGDHIFCSLQSGAPAADRLLTDGPGRSFWKTCQDISLLAPASLTAVAGDAIRRAWLGKPPFRALRDPALLSAEAAGKPAEVPHPWLRLPPGALPGKAQQVRLLALAQGLAEGGDPQDPLPMASPLLAQPLAEACLRVPSWLWFAGGHNRVVARHAFEGRLPANVLWRRSKGTPDGFAARIFDANRTALREMLAGGELARRGLIDLKAVFEVIDDPRPVHGDGFRRVLQFADVEAWARGWSQASGTSISLALR